MSVMQDPLSKMGKKKATVTARPILIFGMGYSARETASASRRSQNGLGQLGQFDIGVGVPIVDISLACEQFLKPGLGFCLHLTPIISIGIAKVPDYIEYLASCGRTVLEILKHFVLQFDPVELITEKFHQRVLLENQHRSRTTFLLHGKHPVCTPATSCPCSIEYISGRNADILTRRTPLLN